MPTYDGDANDNTITGSTTVDTINGFGGNDTLIGLQGNDTINGGDGDDIIYGGLSDGSYSGYEFNYLYGDAGADTYYGGTYVNRYYIMQDDLLVQGNGLADYVYFQDIVAVTLDLTATTGLQLLGVQEITFTDFDDVVTGNNNSRRYYLGDGNDMMTAGDTSGTDLLVYHYMGDGDDMIIAGTGEHVYNGGAGIDTVDYSGAAAGLRLTFNGNSNGEMRGGNGVKQFVQSLEIFIGTQFKDIFYSTSGRREYFGGDGDDYFYIDGFDVVMGGAGYDRVFIDEAVSSTNRALNIDLGAQSVEYVKGGSFGDTLDASSMTQAAILFGEGGNDVITGSDFNDLIFAGDGNDQVSSGAGNDTIRTGEGNNFIDAGTGDDKIFVSSGDVVTGGTGFDRVFVTSLGWVATITDIEFVSGGSVQDQIDASYSAVAVKLLGKAGNDVLKGGQYNDELRGDQGNDVLVGNGGNDILDGGAGADQLFGGAGDDKFFVDDGDSVNGGEGYDLLFVRGYSGDTNFDLGAGGIEYASGNIANDTFNGASADFDVKYLGRAGDDVLTGGSGDDFLFGGSGNDILNGGTGTDLLSGDGGADLFVFDAGWGDDKIRDFEDGVDMIDMTSLGITFADLMVTALGTVVTLVEYNGQSITVVGVAAADIDAADFMF